MIALGFLGVLLWLASPVRSTPYHLLPDEAVEEEEHRKRSQAKSIDSVSLMSAGRSGVSDGEEYHCGWVYLTFEYHEVPKINLAVLQDMRGVSRPSGVFFMILHKSSLFLYDNEGQVQTDIVALSF